MRLASAGRSRLMVIRVLVPFAVFSALLATYSGYWLYLSSNLEETIHRLSSHWHGAGIKVEYGELSVGGYPYRLEITASDVKASGLTTTVAWNWRTPVLRAIAHPWKLSHWVTVFESPSEIELDLASNWAAALKAGRGRMSVILGPDELLERVSLDLRDLRVQPNMGSDYADISRFQVHFRRGTPINQTVDAAVFIEELVFGHAHGYFFGQHLQEFNAEISLIGHLPVEWTRAALDRWRQAGGLVELHTLQMRWGDLDVQLDGTFAIDGEYRPIGAASAVMKGYPALLEALGRKGLISDPVVFAAELAFDLLSEPASGDGRGLLRVPVTIQDGSLHLGPVPLMAIGAVIAP